MGTVTQPLAVMMDTGDMLEEGVEPKIEECWEEEEDGKPKKSVNEVLLLMFVLMKNVSKIKPKKKHVFNAANTTNIHTDAICKKEEVTYEQNFNEDEENPNITNDETIDTAIDFDI